MTSLALCHEDNIVGACLRKLMTFVLPSYFTYNITDTDIELDWCGVRLKRWQETTGYGDRAITGVKEQTRSLPPHRVQLGLLECSQVMIRIIQRPPPQSLLSHSLVYNMQSYFHNHLPISSNLLYRDWLRRIKVKHSQSCECRNSLTPRSTSHRVNLAL